MKVFEEDRERTTESACLLGLSSLGLPYTRFMLSLGRDVSVYKATVNQWNAQMDISVSAQESVIQEMDPSMH
jgi:hypothetical protein